jgi:hypothetical protein
MSPLVRKLMLTAHVSVAVGWFGAVAAFLALALMNLDGADGQQIGAAALAMQRLSTTVLVPLAVASLVTGVVQALRTPWGLLRHHWVVIKLLLTVFSLFALLMHLLPIHALGEAAARGVVSGDEVDQLRLQLLVDSGAALLVLLVTIALSVLKPAGVTRYGRRRQREEAAAAPRGDAGARLER